MAVQRHPVDSFDKKLNFWEEFADYQLHPIFTRIYKNNRKDKLELSSLFMWALTLCYDRKSSFYNQPEVDKWEVVSEDLFGDPKALLNFALYDDDNEADPFGENKSDAIINIPADLDFRQIITEFEKSIDSPLGLSLRELERKLMERTQFIMETPYTIDSMVNKSTNENPKMVLVKGTAEQLDKMFTNTDKITSLITKAMENLRAASGQGTVKGGQMESLGDKGNDF